MAKATQSRMAYLASTNTTPTAYASVVGPSIYTSTDPYLSFVQTPDPNRKSEYLQNINRTLSAQAAPEGFAGNRMQYLLTLLRTSKLSKAKTPLTNNMIGIEDSAALEKVINAAYASNQEPIEWLSRYTGSLGPKVIKQPDTTTKFTKQIQTAFQYKDLGDARQAYSNAYFTAFGVYPSADLDKKFQNSFNAQEKLQNQPTTTAGKVEQAPIYDTKSKPIIDPKTKKQAVDAFGNKKFSKIKTDSAGVKQYTPITTGTSTRQGEGFTAEEQKQHLADFLVANFPEESWDINTLGGSAKSAYDALRAANTNNYGDEPDLATLSPIIKSLLKSTDADVSTTILKSYQDDARKKAGTRFMSIADSIAAGKDAKEIIDPLIKTVSQFLEKDVTLNDTFMKKILNFQGSDGKYRMMNDYELHQALIKHPDYGKTSTAKNESVNLFQSLKGALQ